MYNSIIYEFRITIYEYILIPVLFLWTLGCSTSSQVTITDGAMSAGQECYRIETPTATYLYQKEAGGFSNIYDSQGTDWVKFNKLDEASFPASAAADYRGLPNMVYKSDDGGAGHPGFDKMTSEKISDHQIRSVSKSGKWQWTWSFYEDFAELLVEKTDPDHAYWFLYEGPVAGKFSPKSHYWGSDKSGPNTNTPDLFQGPEFIGHWHTMYFGDINYDQVFYAQQMEQDTLRDHFTYLGNSDQGIDSEDGMVVFGFGRAPKAVPLMRKSQKFRIGFYDQQVSDEAGHKRILDYINSR